MAIWWTWTTQNNLVPLFWQLSCSSKKKPNQNLFLRVLRQTRLSCFESTTVWEPRGKDYIFLAICRLDILRWNVCRWKPSRSMDLIGLIPSWVPNLGWAYLSYTFLSSYYPMQSISQLYLVWEGHDIRSIPWCISKCYCLLLGCTCSRLLSLLNLHVISNLGIVGNRPDLWNGERGSPKGSTGVYKVACQWRSLRRHALHMRAITLSSCLFLLYIFCRPWSGKL